MPNFGITRNGKNIILPKYSLEKWLNRFNSYFLCFSRYSDNPNATTVPRKNKKTGKLLRINSPNICYLPTTINLHPVVYTHSIQHLDVSHNRQCDGEQIPVIAGMITSANDSTCFFLPRPAQDSRTSRPIFPCPRPKPIRFSRGNSARR